MSDPHERPPLPLRVDDVRVDRSAPTTTAHGTEPSPDEQGTTPVPPAGTFRTTLGRILDNWHVIPTEPWW